MLNTPGSFLILVCLGIVANQDIYGRTVMVCPPNRFRFR